MKYLLKVVFWGCFVLFGAGFFSQAGAACEKEFVHECFYPSTYEQPGVFSNGGDYDVCKTWTSGTIKCPGEYLMAVYVAIPSYTVVTYVSYETTCPGNVKVETLSGAEVENVLRTYTSQQLAQLSTYEIRNGKTPVFIRFKCYENGEGNVTFKLHCGDHPDLRPDPDPQPGIQQLLLRKRK